MHIIMFYLQGYSKESQTGKEDPRKGNTLYESSKDYTPRPQCSEKYESKETEENKQKILL